jgi:hypothetical protein
LNVTAAADVSVLGDGAEWIWNLADEHLPQAQGTLDVFHAIEHVADAVKAVGGQDNPVAASHIDADRAALLESGKPGLERWLGGLFPQVPDGVPTQPLISLAAYFAKHPTRLNYAGRLAEGRSIGSGSVEGACKQLIGRRMKQTGASWTVPNGNRMAELCRLTYSDQWNDYWLAT